MALVDTYRRLKSPVRPFVRRHWQHPIVAGAADVARRVLAIYENQNHDFSVNGEAEVVRRLAGFGADHIVDVGGFDGDWSALARSVFPHSRIECYEASPGPAAGLESRFNDDDLLRVHPRALGDRVGTATLYVHSGHASLTSLVPSDPDLTHPVEVPVVRGDDELERLGIEGVDLLKIDAEGYDLPILRGFSRSLESGRIGVVQFEYNTWNIRSRCLLADFYELLEPFGYRIGKVHPNGVDFRCYTFDQENWIGPACVAVHRSKGALVDLLSTKG